MADRAVIRVEGLGKKYVIGHRTERERYVALRDVLARSARGVVRKAADMARGRIGLSGGTVEEFWALKDLSFEIKRGEVLGIIGRNGAGKSTLLKILSRITEPSTGRVTIEGRVASLLEVGTGFHPELTGRENIYLNGAILGMTRADIRRRFDAIVAFAEVEKFLDTPVKRFSSGMYVRLAFAVAAHLEPEILVVDEVLAVGDAEFQKKCLGKMSDVAGGGRTVLFVSHNLGALTTLCPRSLLLDRGKLVTEGPTPAVINSYVRQWSNAEHGTFWSWPDGERPGSPDFRLVSVEIHGEDSPGPVFTPAEALTLTITYDQFCTLKLARILLEVETEGGDIAFSATDQGARGERAYPPGRYSSRCVIPGGLLNRMTYTLRLWAAIPAQKRLMEPLAIGRFQIEGTGNEGSLYMDNDWSGAVCPRLEWAVAAHSTEPARLPAEETQ
jgi:lipopolysaccharide transport system ATP-binding protein